jgi:hypothetical protein
MPKWTSAQGCFSVPTAWWLAFPIACEPRSGAGGSTVTSPYHPASEGTHPFAVPAIQLVLFIGEQLCKSECLEAKLPRAILEAGYLNSNGLLFTT